MQRKTGCASAPPHVFIINSHKKQYNEKLHKTHSRFFFGGKGAEKKLSKKKAPKENFAHCGVRPRLRASAGAAF